MSIRPSLYGTQDFAVPVYAVPKAHEGSTKFGAIYLEICMDIPSVTYRLLELIRYLGKALASRLWC
jgi:hypothetical protein